MAPPENMASDGSIIQVQHFRNASLVWQRNEVGGGEKDCVTQIIRLRAPANSTKCSSAAETKKNPINKTQPWDALWFMDPFPQEQG
jgi:hypothetical protein